MKSSDMLMYALALIAIFIMLKPKQSMFCCGGIA